MHFYTKKKLTTSYLTNKQLSKISTFVSDKKKKSGVKGTNYRIYLTPKEATMISNIQCGQGIYN